MAKHDQAALEVLQSAVDLARRSLECDRERTFKALEYLERGRADAWQFDQFRRAMNDRPDGRYQLLSASLNGIRLLVGGEAKNPTR